MKKILLIIFSLILVSCQSSTKNNELKKESKTQQQSESKKEVKQKDQSDALKQKVEETKKTQPVQPKPRKEMQKDVVLPQHQKKQTISQPIQPVVKPEVPKSLPKPPVASAKPKPTPVPEKPTPTKYCNYTGNRKMVHNICNYGSPWATAPTGWKATDYVVKKWVEDVNSGFIEKVVFKQEPERYHLIETDYLREGLKNAKDPMANCFIGGTCRGFRVDNP